MFVKVLHLRIQPGSTYCFEEMYTVDTPMKPVTLMRNLLALSDDISQTAIWNWQTGSYAILQHLQQANDGAVTLQARTYPIILNILLMLLMTILF
jgi:predicted Abi (CAAX) family protease